ncbi:MAG: hypothetical protein JSV91_01905 [Phycisphaerales bacterium]|nr:MAG: hypothetical protein JSV91_01905 [Phycisphaerales bacterium]
MRNVLIPLMILAVVMSAVSEAAAQGDRRNAATWYRKVVEALGWDYEINSTYPNSERMLTLEEQDILDAYRNDPSGGPSPEVRRVLTKAGPIMEWLRRGSQQRYSDFELDYSQGYGLLLPHLPSLRNAATVMYTDALVRMHDGDTAGVTDRVASLYRMSGHVGSDRVIISSLVGSAVFIITDRATQTALDRGQLSAFDSAILVNALKTLDARDPFNYVEAVAGEQVIAVDWMAQSLSTREERQKFLDYMEGSFAGEEVDRFFAESSDEEFSEEIGRYDNYMSGVIEAFMIEDPEEGKAALAQLREQAEAGEHGRFPKDLAPAFARILDHMHESRDMVAERLAELEKLAQGELKPEELANAAVFYERGIKQMRELENDRFQAVLDYQSGTIEDADESILKTLADAQGVVDLFREGSEKHRCDFGYLRRRPDQHFCPDYLAGMRDALRLILADAMHLLEADEADAAVDRLAICYRAVAHLTDDELILSALIAHRAFEETHRLGHRFPQSAAWTDAHRESLLKAVERIGRKDPFGYINSIMATRDRLAKLLKRLPRNAEAEEGRPTREEATERIKALNGDQLLCLTAARDTVIQAAAKPADSNAADVETRDQTPHPLTRMEGIIDFEALVAVRDEAEATVALFDAGRIDEIFSNGGFPRVAPALQWMRRARADLRDCIIRLRPPMADPTTRTEPPD